MSNEQNYLIDEEPDPKKTADRAKGFFVICIRISLILLLILLAGLSARVAQH